MNVLPFRKPPTQVLNTVAQPQQSRLMVFPRRRNDADEIDLRRKPRNDFNHEIEMTRSHKPLMALLEARAKEPATLSFCDVKMKIEVDGTNR